MDAQLVHNGRPVRKLGYGGSAVECETLVYSYRGLEVRVPTGGCTMTPEEIEDEYSAVSADTIDEALERADEILDELS